MSANPKEAGTRRGRDNDEEDQRNKEKKRKTEEDYVCSITSQIMVDPVCTDDGHTYEREAIEKWLERHDTSPETGKKLDNKRLKPNWALKKVISKFLEEHPELYSNDKVYLPKSWIHQLAAAIKENRIGEKEVNEWLVKDRRLLTLKLEGEYTAFHLAAQFSSAKLADILLKKLIERNELKNLPKPRGEFRPLHLNALLEWSLLASDQDRFSLLLKLGADLHHLEEGTQNSLLHKLVIHGNPEPVTWLLERGLAIESRNREGNTPLLLAILHGHVELTGLLLNRGANPRAKNKQNQNAIAVALIQQNKPLLHLLVDPEKAVLPPLHLALALNDLELLKLLLKQAFMQTSLEKVDKAGQTAFYGLVAKNPKEMKEREEAATLLIAAGADPTVTCGPEKLTPLHLAAEQGDLSMLTLLLKTKAATSMDAEDIHGNTPFHLAAKAGHDELVVKLLEAGASYEARNQEDRTPRGLARSQNKVKTAAVITRKVRALKREQSEELQRLRQGFQDQARQLEQQMGRIGEQAAKIEQLERESVQMKERKISAEKEVKGQAEKFEELERAFSREEKRNAELLEQGKKALTFCVEKLNKREPLIKTLSGHIDVVKCLQILPNGQLASGSHDESIKVWDLSSGVCLKTLTGHTLTVSCLQLLPDGQLASGSWDDSIKVWDLSSGACLKTLSGHTDVVGCLQILPNGQLASGSWDHSIKVWDLSSGACLKTLSEHTDWVNCLQILPNGQLASGSEDKSIKVWDLSSGACLKTLSEHTKSVFCLQMLPNRQLASGSDDGSIKVWDLRSSGACLKTLSGHTLFVNCLQLLPNGQLASGSWDHSIKVWGAELWGTAELFPKEELEKQLAGCRMM